MRTGRLLFLLVLLGCSLGSAAAQIQQGESGRLVVKKTSPRYPEIARRMNIAGTVKVFAVVAADGKVKSVEPLGGSPLLIEAAKEAITQWKFAPASAESKELIELHFSQ
jgi:TonB family protein